MHPRPRPHNDSVHTERSQEDCGPNQGTELSPRKIPRGKGYDKVSIKNHIKKIDCFDGPLDRYCRSSGLSVDSFVLASQKHFPEWWSSYAKGRNDLVILFCAYCKDEFYPNSAKQTFCSRKCSSDSRRDRDYFGGNRRSGVGIVERICQLCHKPIQRNMHAHHVYGKKADPDNEHLVALHAGCHVIVEKLSATNMADDVATWERLMNLVWLKRDGSKEENMGRSLEVNITRTIR